MSTLNKRKPSAEAITIAKFKRDVRAKHPNDQVEFGDLKKDENGNWTMEFTIISSDNQSSHIVP